MPVIITGENQNTFATLITPQYTQRIWLEVINAGHGLTDRVVTSLRAIKDSGLSVRQYPFGGPATAGDLEIGFTPPFTVADATLFSSYAAADLNEWEIQRTAAVSGLRVDSTKLKITHSDQKTDNYHYGRVTLGDPTGAIGRELPFEAIHLNGVEEAVEREAIGLAFPSNHATSLLARVTVPFDDTFTQFGVTLLFGILLPGTGSIRNNAFTLSYRIISNPVTSVGINAYNAPTQAFPDPQLQSLNCDFTANSPTYATAYYTTESDKLYVSPGDILLLKIERAANDGYANRIILLRKSAILYAN
jgi:hypothetical protein